MNAPLIAAPDLIAALACQDQDWLILDCRFNLGNPQAGEQAYAQGHIAGALYAHLDRDLSGAKTGRNGRHPLPTTEAFEQTVRTWGITPGTRVVAYDDAGGMFAARLWWLLRFHGFDQVQVLDGGWQAWQAELACRLDQGQRRLLALWTDWGVTPLAAALTIRNLNTPDDLPA